MGSFRCVLVDLFTDRLLAGNAPAVFIDGRGLDDRQIARAGDSANGRTCVEVGVSAAVVARGESRL